MIERAKLKCPNCQSESFNIIEERRSGTHRLVTVCSKCHHSVRIQRKENKENPLVILPH